MRRLRGDEDAADWYLVDWRERESELTPAPLLIEQFVAYGHLVVRAEVPGVDPDRDIEIRVEDHVLHIRAERREAPAAAQRNEFRSDFRYGAFARSIPLPAGAMESQVQAICDNGILDIDIPIDLDHQPSNSVPVERRRKEPRVLRRSSATTEAGPPT
jgi:HSP20 family molecular chaperone IbpA